MADLYLNISKPRKDVKKILGQANHFLITILVGLNYVEKNDVALPADFSTSWNPKDKSRSVARSREYALNASLAWAVDCLDAYFSKINKSPKLLEDTDVINEIDGAGRSVYKSFDILSKYFISGKSGKDDFLLYKSFVDLAIQWRNNTTHYNAENPIERESEKFLLEKAELIEKEFCGLKIGEALKHFNDGDSPTFKEVTSLIRAIHNYIEILDQYLLSRLDVKRYAYEILNKFFSKKTRRRSYPTLTERRRDMKIKNILQGWAFSDEKTGCGTCLCDAALKQISDDLIKSWAKK